MNGPVDPAQAAALTAPEDRPFVSAMRAELERLRAENAGLAEQLTKLQAASALVREARRAALNVMEDAVESRRRAELLNAELQREIAVRQHAEASLRDADRRKNHFLAMLAHELRNPLAAIRGGIALLQSEKTKPETRAASLPIVAQQVAHMERLVDDLLDITRISQGRVRLRRERTTIQSAIEHAVRMVQTLPGAEGFEFRLDLAAEPLRVTGDPVRLTQVFANILGNAVKYSGESRRIDITAALDGAEVVTRIRDYGQGIEPRLLADVFEPFVQGEPSGTLAGGLGLGLTVVRDLVGLHGGRVEALSDGAGSGSEFIVHLPVDDERS